MTVEVSYVMVFQDSAGEWRWTAHSANNKKVATSGEGLENEGYARTVARDLFPNAKIKPEEEEDGS